MSDAHRARVQTLSLAVGLLLIGIAGQILFPHFRPPWITAGLFAALTTLIWYDFRHMILPNVFTYPLVLAGLFWTIWSGNSIPHAIIGGALGYGLVLLINLIWQARRGMDGMGLGDAKLLAAAGTWMGPFALAPLILIGSSTALILVIISGGGLKIDREKRVPFGPFIALGFWACWVLPIVPVV